jgi:hypothetical protein
MDKSYVTMEQKLCPVCGTTFDSGALLLDKRLNNTFDRKTTTAFMLCEDCKAKSEEYLALVVVDESKSVLSNDGTLKSESAYRTGEIIHIKRTAAKKMFSIEHSKLPMVFIDQTVARNIKEMVNHNERIKS